MFTLVILALEPDTLKALYISPLWILILSVTYRVLYKPRMRRLNEKSVV
jgi:D-serine/D-alanine/glycine transporter